LCWETGNKTWLGTMGEKGEATKPWAAKNARSTTSRIKGKQGRADKERKKKKKARLRGVFLNILREKDVSG